MPPVTFNKGDVIFFSFPPESGHVINGRHRAVVLHTYLVPNQTITLVPISSAVNDDGSPKQLESYHVPLDYRKYEFLRRPSYIKTDQILTFDRRDLIDADGVGYIDEEDSALLDLNIMAYLEMENTVSAVIEAELRKVLRTS